MNKDEKTKEDRKNIAMAAQDALSHYRTRLRQGDNDSGATKNLVTALRQAAEDLEQTVRPN